MNDDRTKAFLQSLWRGAAYGNYWRSSDKQSQWTTTMPLADCELGGSNVYMSVNPTRAPRGKYERTRIEDVAVINCLFCEWDVKDFSDADALRAHVKGLAVQPQVIVWSGGGAHGYWFIDEPMPVTPDGSIYLRGIQAVWVKLCGGDPGARDMARVLRLPGTLNAKYSPPRKVDFARFNLLTAPRYKLADLCAMAEPYWQDEDNSPVTTVTTNSTVEQGRHGAVAAVIARLKTAQVGKRNKLLLWAACKLFEHGLSPASVELELLPVADDLGLTAKESLATIRSAAKQPARTQESTMSRQRNQPRSDTLADRRRSIAEALNGG